MSSISVRRVCVLVAALWLLLSGCGAVDAGRSVPLPGLGVQASPTPGTLTPAQAAQVALREWSGVVDALSALDDGQLGAVETEPQLSLDRVTIAQQRQAGKAPGQGTPAATVEEAYAVGPPGQADSIVARISTAWGAGSQPVDTLVVLTHAGTGTAWKLAWSSGGVESRDQLGTVARPQGPLDRATAGQLTIQPDDLASAYVGYLTGGNAPFAPGMLTNQQRDGLAASRSAYTRKGAGWDFSAEPSDAVQAYRAPNGGAIVFFEIAAREHLATHGAVCLKQDQGRANYGPSVPPGSYDELTREVRGPMLALVPKRGSNTQVVIAAGYVLRFGASTKPSTDPRCL